MIEIKEIGRVRNLTQTQYTIDKNIFVSQNFQEMVKKPEILGTTSTNHSPSLVSNEKHIQKIKQHTHQIKLKSGKSILWSNKKGNFKI